MKRVTLVALSIAALVSLPRAIRADEPHDDDAMIERGVALREEGRDREALAEFERAYALRRTPRARAQIALAHQALGEWVEAERGLRDALAAAGDPWIERNRAALDEALIVVRRHLAWIEVEVNVPSAQVLLDGTRTAAMPRDGLRVVAGAHVIEAHADGYETARRRIEVEPGGRAHEVIILVRVAAPPQIARPLAPAPPPRAGTTALWITGITGGISLGVGVVANVVRENNAAIYNDDSRCRYGGIYRDVRCGSYRATAESATTIAILGYAGAGVAALTAAGIELLAPRFAERKIGVACAPGGPALGVACAGAF